MKIIAGLGNPGEQYKNTRHNAGFLAVDYVLGDDGFMTARPGKEFKSDIFSWLAPASPNAGGGQTQEKIIFVKPLTYMNDSGQALKLFCNFYKLDFKTDLLIIHDDVDLPLGTFRSSVDSSAAGHKGVQSIIDCLGTQNFRRIRIGIESRPDKAIPPTEAFVLQNFTGEEIKKLQDEIFPKVRMEIKKFLQD
ncbi:MAG: aminoacyl-tRNA hydrolase [Patescibacteria group bacterium]|nr:aminoacyl-tRNA hydrolase [Patescibacteria group bacterium]